MDRPWEASIPRDELEAFASIGLGRASNLGKKPALLIIDVQYRTVGTTPQRLVDAIKEYRTSCGIAGWEAIPHIAELLNKFRANAWPVIYPFVSPKENYDRGRTSEKLPEIMLVDSKGYEFVQELAPADGDILLPKKHASAFFGTPLLSYLIQAGVDSLVVTGCSTSGCVRATVVDAVSYNYRVSVPYEAVYDRSITSHNVSLFDIASKYGNVERIKGVCRYLDNLSGQRSMHSQ